jgi:two-component system, chemotaxis family, response regulator Rcp1
MSSPQRRILLIEDNPADAKLSKIVHDEVQHCSWLDIVHDGHEAVRHLCGDGEYAGKTRPDVILLDMTLPMKSGLELIAQIRALPGCELIPIVMVSGSENPVTIKQAYELGANCVIQKSSNWDEYFRKLESCYDFWCGVVELPHQPSAPSN